MQGIPYSANPLAPAFSGFSPVIKADVASVTMPDLTLFNVLPTVVNPANSQLAPASLTLADSWTVATGFTAGVFSAISPAFAPVAKGLWGTKVMTPPVLSTTVSAGNAIVIMSSAVVDTNIAVLFYREGALSTLVKVVAINTDTGAAGAPQLIATAAVGVAYTGIWKTVADGFFCTWNDSGLGTSAFRAGSVAPATLAITLGAALSSGGNVVVDCVQMNATVFLTQKNAAAAFRSVVVNTGTLVCSLGAGAVASGSINDATGLTVLRILPSTATEALAILLSAGGGTNITRALASRTVSVDAAGAITVNALSTSATNNLGESLRQCNFTLQGTTYFATAQHSTATTGAFYGISVAGIVATTGAQTTRANDLPAVYPANGPLIYVNGSAAPGYTRWDNQTVLFGHLATGIYAMSITAGTTLTFGATLAYASAKTFLQDARGLGTIYAVGGSVYDKIASVSGGLAITSAWQIASSPTIVKDDYLNDDSVSYSGVWYDWTLPTIIGAVSANYWCINSGNNLQVVGSVR